MLQSMGRYLALGLIALPLAWLGRARLRQLSRHDWWTALGLTMMGEPYLLRLPGQRHSAHRGAGFHHDYRHAAGGTAGVRQSALQPARREAAVATPVSGADLHRCGPDLALTSRSCVRGCRILARGATAPALRWRWDRWSAGPGMPCATPAGCGRTRINRQ